MREKKDEVVLLNRDYIDTMITLTRENKMANFLFLFFMRRMDAQNSCHVSTTELQQELGCSKMTIYKAVRYLKNLEWISVRKNGTSNVYIVNPEVACVE